MERTDIIPSVRLRGGIGGAGVGAVVRVFENSRGVIGEEERKPSWPRRKVDLEAIEEGVIPNSSTQDFRVRHEIIIKEHTPRAARCNKETSINNKNESTKGDLSQYQRAEIYIICMLSRLPVVGAYRRMDCGI